MTIESQQTDEGAQSEAKPTTEPSAFQQVAALLRGETESGDDAQGERKTEGKADAKQASDKPKGKPKSLADVADRLGIDVAELYNVEFGMPNDTEKHTLGKLKDFYGERENFTIEQMRWAENKAQQDGEQLRARNELTELMAMLPPEAIKPEVLNKIREKHTAVIARERGLTLVAIPEWKDEKARDADMASMREHLSRAGFPTGYLDRVTDHMTMRYIRENYLREQRIQKALDMVKPKSNGGVKPSHKGDPARAANKGSAPQRGSRQVSNQIAQVADLLKQSE